MLYSPLGRLLKWVVVSVLGKAWDSVSGGDPLSPDYSFVEVEKTEKDPLHPLRVIETELHRDEFRRVVGVVHERLDKGFREVQREILYAQAGRLKEGGQFQLLCSLFHEGAPTGLQINLWGRGAGNLLLHAEGRGPAVEVLYRELVDSGGIASEDQVERLVDREVRDGRFRRDERGTEWTAKLPVEAGTIFGLPVTVWAEAGRPGLGGAGDVMATPVLEEIMADLPGLLAQAEGRMKDYFGEDDLAALARKPTIRLNAEIDDEREWSLGLSRADWPDYGWDVDYLGVEIVDLWAGD